MNRKKRLINSLIMSLLPIGGGGIAKYIKKHGLYGSVGEGCVIQKRKLPLYSNLVHLGNNVVVASNVGFVTHDAIHLMLNRMYGENAFVERIGCILVKDNVFIGSGTRILYGTMIGSNVIIGSDSLVNKDIPDNSVYAGVPARFICTFDEYVQKAKAYSEKMKNTFGVDRIKQVDDVLADKVFREFIKEKGIQ